MAHALPFLLLFVSTAWGAFSSGDALDYSLSIQLYFQGDQRSSTLSEEIGKRLQEDIESRGCVSRVLVAGPENPKETDLLLRIRLKDLLEETRYAVSIAERARNQDPTTQRSYVAVFEVMVRVELIEATGGAILRSGRFRQANARSPHTFGEDAAAAVKEEALGDMIRRIRRKVCGGSPHKLHKKILAAREKATPPPPESR